MSYPNYQESALFSYQIKTSQLSFLSGVQAVDTVDTTQLSEGLSPTFLASQRPPGLPSHGNHLRDAVIFCSVHAAKGCLALWNCGSLNTVVVL